MKKNNYLKSFVALFFGAWILSSSLLVQANGLKLSVGDFQNTEHIISKEGTTRWMKLVEDRTNGAVSFVHYPAQQAAPSRGLLDAVKSKIVDIALLGPSYNSDRLPLNSMIGLPGLYSSATQGSTALNVVINQEGPLRDEFLKEDVIPIFSVVLPPYQVLLKENEVTSLEQWKGLKIRTSGTTQAMTARAIGSSAVSLAGPEVYMAVERGRVDGIFFPLPSVSGYKLQEVVKHISINGSFGGYSFVLGINKKVFESLSEEVRQVMIETGKEISAHLGSVQDEAIKELTQQWTSAGVNVFEFSDAELTNLNNVTASVKGEWIKRVGKNNPKASDALKLFEDAISAQ